MHVLLYSRLKWYVSCFEKHLGLLWLQTFIPIRKPDKLVHNNQVLAINAAPPLGQHMPTLVQKDTSPQNVGNKAAPVQPWFAVAQFLKAIFYNYKMTCCKLKKKTNKNKTCIGHFDDWQ